MLRWINVYRTRRDLAHVPDAVRALSQLGGLRDPENSAVYVGFIAGIIGSNPGKADELIGKMLPLPPEDDWALVRGIAYSGAPGWKDMLDHLAERLPRRRPMIDKYVNGKLATLDDVSFAARRPPWTRFATSDFSKPPEAVKLDAESRRCWTPCGAIISPAAPMGRSTRILRMLTWSKERDDTERLTVGNMAKYTLASNAARDADLLAMLKRGVDRQPADIQPILKEVIEAAETMEIAHIRKAALASIEDLKRKGPGLQARHLDLGTDRAGRRRTRLHRRRGDGPGRDRDSLRSRRRTLLGRAQLLGQGLADGLSRTREFRGQNETQPRHWSALPRGPVEFAWRPGVRNRHEDVAFEEIARLSTARTAGAIGAS